jgi:hypothetical protein
MARTLSVSALILFAAAPALRADEPDAKATVTRAVKAMGCKDDGKPLNMAWKDTGAVSIGGMKIDYTAEFAFRAPDALRFDMMIEFMGMKLKLIGVVAGDKVWEAADGKVEESTGEKKEHSQALVYHAWVITLTQLAHDKGFKLSSVVGKKVDDKPTLGVLVERKDKPVVTLYFDKQTGLLAKSEVNVKDEFQGWKEVLEETYYEDYKEENGRKVFGKVRVVRDGKTFIESNPSDMKTPEKLEAKLFEKP